MNQRTRLIINALLTFTIFITLILALVFVYKHFNQPQNAVVLGQTSQQSGLEPISIVSDITSETEGSTKEALKRYRPAEEDHSETNWLEYLLYLLLGILLAANLKRIVRVWHYLIKNSV